MSGDTRNAAHDALLDELALVVDGDAGAIDRHMDLLTDDDRARDLLHGARGAAEAIAEAGADYRPPADLEARLFAALDARETTSGAPVVTTTPEEPDGPSTREAAPASGASPRPAVELDAPTPSGRGPARWPWFLAAAAVLLAAATTLYPRGEIDGEDRPGPGPAPPPIAFSPDALTGTLQRVAGAADGVKLRAVDGSLGAVTPGAEIPAGAALQTEAHTRARVELSDGSVVVLDGDTTLALRPEARALALESGTAMIEVSPWSAQPQATIDVGGGRIDSAGGKLVVRASESPWLQVVRGTARILGDAAPTAVRAGEVGRFGAGASPSVSVAADPSRALAWADLDGASSAPDRGLPGIGRLSARRPGEREDRDRPLTLAHHRVEVRIAGPVARTTIEETFQNDGPHVLEGIYSFPLPPDARIAGLELEVNGRWERGGFVSRERAKKIWRGVIRNATPVAARRNDEEWIWVPGPWKDPALLEWQKGGRFELRIYPIPAHGARRIRLVYEQNLPAHGAGTRYAYPLPRAVDDSLRIGRFDVDVRVVGAKRVTPGGYALFPTPGAAGGPVHAMRYTAQGFLPTGDLTLDIEPDDAGAELTWWAWRGRATAAPPARSREGEPGVHAAHQQLHADPRGYVTFAVKPTLPPWTEDRRRDVVIAVDLSRSMIGERARRAIDLAGALVEEMDRRDHVTVLACDSTCQAMGGDALVPSPASARRVRSWLNTVEVAGATDLLATLRAALDAGRAVGSRDLRVFYIGDGQASVGHRRPDAVVQRVQAMTADGRATISTIGVGSDADTPLLAAVARAGGGHAIPYLPGRRVQGTALDALMTLYGPTLTDARLSLPPGIESVAPAALPNLRRGQTALVVGRLAPGATMSGVRGEALLSGQVGGKPWQRSWTIEVAPRTDARNAFVPRQWATETIAALETAPRPDTDRIVALSKAYGVMSRLTSLLVLESEAMFRAFGVDRARPTVDWTAGEEGTAGMAGLANTPDTVTGALAAKEGRKDSDASPAATPAIVGETLAREMREARPSARRGDGVARNEQANQQEASRTMLDGLLDANSGGGSAPMAEDEAFADASAAGVVQPRAAAARESAGPMVFGEPMADAPAPARPRLAEESAGSEALDQSGAASRGARSKTAKIAKRPTRRPKAKPRVNLGSDSVDDLLGGIGTRPRGGSASGRGALDSGDSRATRRPLGRRNRGQWMKRERYIEPRIVTAAWVDQADLRAAQQAEAALTANPDSRDRQRALVRALNRAGQLPAAVRAAERWLVRDQLDAEALTYLSDALGRMGDQARAVRVLTGIVDLQDDPVLHRRLANAFDRVGETARACAHRVARAELMPDDAAVIAEAVRCERAMGWTGELVLGAVDGSKLRRRVDRELAKTPANTNRPRGRLILDASWSSGEDLDLTLVTPQGTRLSWMGGRRSVVGAFGRTPGREVMGLRRASPGRYHVEISRARATPGAPPVTGQIEIRAFGQRRTVPFTLAGERLMVAVVDLQRRTRLVPGGGPNARPTPF